MRMAEKTLAVLRSPRRRVRRFDSGGDPVRDPKAYFRGKRAASHLGARSAVARERRPWRHQEGVVHHHLAPFISFGERARLGYDRARCHFHDTTDSDTHPQISQVISWPGFLPAYQLAWACACRPSHACTLHCTAFSMRDMLAPPVASGRLMDTHPRSVVALTVCFPCRLRSGGPRSGAVASGQCCCGAGTRLTT